MRTVWGNQAPAAGSIRSMARRMPLPALLLLAGLLLSTLPLGWCEDAPPTATTAEQTARSIEGLTSPLERSRRAAVADLIAGLPATRSAVIAALPESTPAVQLLLVDVSALERQLDQRTIAPVDQPSELIIEVEGLSGGRTQLGQHY